MHWADKITTDIVKTNQYRPYWVDDMFTPSGFAHVGSLRGPLVHDLVYRALQRSGEETVYTFVINDFDPIDGLPDELMGTFSRYMGFPLRVAPSPELGFGSFAEYFREDFIAVLSSLGVTPKFLSSWDMYHGGKFDEVIREALDNASKIQDIYQNVSGSQKRELGWLPLQVICENCGKLGTTRVFDWDGKTVAYKCEPTMVSWAQGCGHEGRISPFGGNGKLPWKVDWPAHWKVIGITIEGAGKDHSTSGGSRDIARQLCKDIFSYPEPYNFAYEFFLLGGKKTSSSKGIGLRAKDLVGILPAPIARFLFARTDYRQTIEFDPMGNMMIPDLFDEYDRCWQSYNKDGEDDLSRTFELSQIEILPPKLSSLFIPRFRDVANLVQQGVDLKIKFEEVKGQNLSDFELEILEQRARYAQIWINTYAPEDYRFKMSEDLPDVSKNLTEDQKLYLEKVVGLIQTLQDQDELQTGLYDLSKEMKIPAKDAFAAIYQVFLGKSHGPRAGWFLLQQPKERVIQRLEEALHR